MKHVLAPKVSEAIYKSKGGKKVTMNVSEEGHNSDPAAILAKEFLRVFPTAERIEIDLSQYESEITRYILRIEKAHRDAGSSQLIFDRCEHNG